jgi:hypothetical protein
MNISRRKITVLLVMIMTIFAVIFFTPLLPRALATTITSLAPERGFVGSIIRVIGEIDTSGGVYQIYWDAEILLKEGTCASGSTVVNDTFTVPSSSEGAHNILLYDPIESTVSDYVQFVLAVVSMSIEPARIQEGLNTTITVGMQEAEANKNYPLTMIVTTPTTVSYTTDLIVTTDDVGFGTVSKFFWGDFPNANTNFVGTYSVTVNKSLATGNFTVGLTNKLLYEPAETVYIQGSGYYPNENVIVNIKFGEASIAGYPKNIMTDMEGALDDSWTIPIGTATGTYTVTLVSATTSGTLKEQADVQDFNVRLICQIQTRNLNDEPLADVTVEVYNATDDFLISEKTNETGWTVLFLETGYYTFKAYWMDLEVASLTNQIITASSTLTLKLQLVHIQMIVEAETGEKIPSTDLTLKASNNNQTIFETQLKTSFNGSSQILNMPTNTSYNIEARRYGYLFYNETTFIGTSPPMPWISIFITAPSYTMLIQVLDSKNAPAKGLTVNAYEWSSGIALPIQFSTTDSEGNVTLSLTFGKYKIRVYDDTVLLNETAIDLTSNRSSLMIYCEIYKANLKVVVTDYFGQPIPNTPVIVERKIDSQYVETEQSSTKPDGVASFDEIIGGDSRISMLVAGKIIGVQNLYIAGSKQVTFRMEGYVTVAGYALETSQFTIIVLLIIIMVSFIIAITYKRIQRVFTKKNFKIIGKVKQEGQRVKSKFLG